MGYILTDVLFASCTVDGTKKLYLKLISYILSVKRVHMLVDAHGYSLIYLVIRNYVMMIFYKIHKPACLGKENLGCLKDYNWQAEK